MTITYFSGKKAEGVLLAARGLEMRVAVKGHRDAAEFRFRGGLWFAEEGDPVEVDFPDLPSGFTGNSMPAYDRIAGMDVASQPTDAGRWLN